MSSTARAIAWHEFFGRSRPPCYAFELDFGFVHFKLRLTENWSIKPSREVCYAFCNSVLYIDIIGRHLNVDASQCHTSQHPVPMHMSLVILESKADRIRTVLCRLVGYTLLCCLAPMDTRIQSKADRATSEVWFIQGFPQL